MSGEPAQCTTIDSPCIGIVFRHTPPAEDVTSLSLRCCTPQASGLLCRRGHWLEQLCLRLQQEPHFQG